jgi:hypothetical protein
MSTNGCLQARTGISSVFPKDVISVAQKPSMPRGLCAGAIASVTLKRISEVWRRLQTQLTSKVGLVHNIGCDNNYVCCNSGDRVKCCIFSHSTESRMNF